MKMKNRECRTDSVFWGLRNGNPGYREDNLNIVVIAVIVNPFSRLGSDHSWLTLLLVASCLRSWSHEGCSVPRQSVHSQRPGSSLQVLTHGLLSSLPISATAVSHLIRSCNCVPMALTGESPAAQAQQSSRYNIFITARVPLRCCCSGYSNSNSNSNPIDQLLLLIST